MRLDFNHRLEITIQEWKGKPRPKGAGSPACLISSSGGAQEPWASPDAASQGQWGASCCHLIIWPPTPVPAVPISAAGMGARRCSLPQAGAAGWPGTEAAAGPGPSGLHPPCCDPRWASVSLPVQGGRRWGSLPCKPPCSGLLCANKPLSGGPPVSPLSPGCVCMTGTQGTMSGRSKGSWRCSPRQ